ncbi:MlaD family protein [Roseomonas sp. NAR14]|uniref:MlaD family protein n=1 Tax=Roseomonas acroporae TaxID=2937791 RepID=A0A9X1YAU9_9PROT|nr:MlaD family protein [Roseomonas acroporae]MCK8783091.1 MlaD family protein [Roseomonas acroporae]
MSEPGSGAPTPHDPARAPAPGAPPSTGGTAGGAAPGSAPHDPAPHDRTLHDEAPEAVRAHHRRFSMIWLIPIAAVLVAGYLGYRTLSARGPLITVTFRNAEGLTAGQTPVRYKAVQVGTVETIALTDDLQRVRVRMRMAREVVDRLTAPARFWVVRPRLSASSVSGLETIVSGSYIEFDPGAPEAEARREFTGLEDPPGVRADQPGRLIRLQAHRIGSLDRGSPVFFRDIAVGEILSYDRPGLDGNITLHAFVRDPYAQYLRAGSRFWNVSGVSLDIGAQGIRLELESLRALLAGGVAFDTPPEARGTPEAKDDAEFPLYPDIAAAAAATSRDRLSFLVYFDGSVRGLAAGSPVEMRGIRIGSVTDVHLEYDRETHAFRTPVHLAVEPGNISYPAGREQYEVLELTRRMVARGLRAQLATGNILIGQKIVTLDFQENPPPAEVRMEGDEIVLPAMPGGDDIMATVSAIAGRLQRFPIDEIGRNLNGALASVNGLVGGPEVRNAVGALSAALAQVQQLVREADRGLAPLLRRLPGIAGNLDQAVARANSAIGSVERGYGGDSDVQRQLQRTLGQVSDAARAVRILADFLDRHPEALIRGRALQGGER